MDYFLSCDWGTSAFRLRLIELTSLHVAGTVETKQGCAEVNRGFLATGQQKEKDRITFYLAIIAEHVRELEHKTDLRLSDVPVVISGMASSTAGLISLPYKELPFLANGSDLVVYEQGHSPILSNKVLIISGVRSQNDVMRGEETKIVGYLNTGHRSNCTLVLPGTHPKHVYMSEGKVSGFTTYMTGEFFSLLSTKSLLALSVTENDQFDDISFTAGIREGAKGELLHSSFLVRINELFKFYTPDQNYHYLSGLLIGAELGNLVLKSCPIVLLENGKSGAVYKLALEILGIAAADAADSEPALIRGQAQILQHFMGG